MQQCLQLGPPRKQKILSLQGQRVSWKKHVQQTVLRVAYMAGHWYLMMHGSVHRCARLCGRGSIRHPSSTSPSIWGHCWLRCSVNQCGCVDCGHGWEVGQGYLVPADERWISMLSCWSESKTLHFYDHEMGRYCRKLLSSSIRGRNASHRTNYQHAEDRVMNQHHVPAGSGAPAGLLLGPVLDEASAGLP